MQRTPWIADWQWAMAAGTRWSKRLPAGTHPSRQRNRYGIPGYPAVLSCACNAQPSIRGCRHRFGKEMIKNET